MVGNDDRPGKRVRLSLVDSTPRSDDGPLGDMKRQAAAWEQSQPDDRPVWLDEIGLEPEEVEQLRGEGAELRVLRAMGRRLRQEGRARTLDAYRELLAVDDGSES